MKTLLITLLLMVFASCEPIVAKGHLEIKGNILSTENKLTSAIIIIEQHNGKVSKLECNGEFSLNLELNKEYSITFIKDNCISKQIDFNTEVVDKNGKYKFEFDVKMENSYKQIEHLIVAYVFYNSILHSFDYAFMKQ